MGLAVKLWRAALWVVLRVWSPEMRCVLVQDTRKARPLYMLSEGGKDMSLDGTEKKNPRDSKKRLSGKKIAGERKEERGEAHQTKEQR